MRPRLPSVLEQRIGRVRGGEGELVRVREVEVVEAEDRDPEGVGWGG